MPKMKDGHLINIFELKDAILYTMRKLEKSDDGSEYHKGFVDGLDGVINTLNAIIKDDSNPNNE